MYRSNTTLLYRLSIVHSLAWNCDQVVLVDLLVNTIIKGATSIVNTSLVFSNKSFPHSPGAKAISNSVTSLAVTIRSSIKASCLPMHEYAPIGLLAIFEDLMGSRGTDQKQMVWRHSYWGLARACPPNARARIPRHPWSTILLFCVSNTLRSLCDRFDLRLPIVHEGAETLTPPGMKISPIIIPCGGVCLSTPPGTGGCKRSASLMTPLRYFASWISRTSVSEPGL